MQWLPDLVSIVPTVAWNSIVNIRNIPVNTVTVMTGVVCGAVSLYALNLLARHSELTNVTENTGTFYERLAKQCSCSGQQKIDLLNLSRIPTLLHGDDIFKRYICPISQQPIRDPVAECTVVGAQIFYERIEIYQWLLRSSTSPVTRQPLTPGDLHEVPWLRNLIEYRLQHHQTQCVANENKGLLTQ